MIARSSGFGVLIRSRDEGGGRGGGCGDREIARLIDCSIAVVRHCTEVVVDGCPGV